MKIAKRHRVLASVLAAVSVFTGSFSGGGLSAFADEIVNEQQLETKLKINKEWRTYDKDFILRILERGNYQLLAPARPFFEDLGAEIQWDGENNRITFIKDGYTGELTIDSLDAVKNGEEVTLPVEPVLVDDTAYVPVEFCGDTLHYKVWREDYGRTIRIVSRVNEYSTKYDGSVKPGMAELVSTYHRPVPTEFEKSSDPNDLIFYQEHEYIPHEEMEAEQAAALDPSKLPTGEVIYDMDDVLDSTPDSEVWCGWWKRETIDDESVPFNEVLRINCSLKPQNRVEYIVKPDARIEEYIDPEDKYLVKFYVKLVDGGNIDTGKGHVMFHIEEDYMQSWQKSVAEEIDFAANEWKVVYLLATGVENANHLGFTPGEYVQTFDIGGLEIQKLSRDADVSQLIAKAKDIDYMDSDLSRDAPWRKEALERIEKVRKGDFKVVVQDKDGNPVPNADVKFDMFEHEFKIGVMLGQDFWKSGYSGYAELDEIGKVFNSVGASNDQKDQMFDCNPQNARRIIDDAKNVGIKYFRGHAIWMPSLEGGTTRPHRFYNEADQESLDFDTLMNYMKEHVNRIVQSQPEIYEWDVSNEMVARVTFDKFGKINVLKHLYDYCNQVFPEGMELAFCDNSPEKPPLWEILESLQNTGAEWDVITIQNHWNVYNTTGVTNQMEYYDRFVYEFGKQFSVTEYSMHHMPGDNSVESYEKGGDITRDFLIACFSHPGCNAFSAFWLTDEYGSWNVFNAPYYKGLMEPNHAWYQLTDLFYNKWWTRDAHTTTDADGKGQVRGFYGDYDVTVTVDGQEVAATMAAFHKGYENELTITIE